MSKNPKENGKYSAGHQGVSCPQLYCTQMHYACLHRNIGFHAPFFLTHHKILLIKKGPKPVETDRGRNRHNLVAILMAALSKAGISA